ncbi:MAG: hypothetical protein JWO62_1010 [Acidimicrobiaceae bacterium]|nr:hypothetical protein [Acidimicrobiaceae bacterium]
MHIADIHAGAAGHLRSTGEDHIALYLAGYFVECNAKAVCLAKGRKPSTAGNAGHDLVRLIELGGSHLSDLRPEWRHFAQHRRVDLRYEESIPSDVDGPEVYAAGHSLGSHLARLANRQRKRSRR